MPPRDVIENGQLVNQLSSLVHEGELKIKHIPGVMREVIETEAWRKRYVCGTVKTHESFRSFIESEPMDGMGWKTQEDRDRIADLLRLDPDLVVEWRRLTTAQHGGDRKSEKAQIKTDNVSLDPEPKHGNSLAYTLTRLARDHGDLYAKVVTKKMSANAAAIEAGIRKPPKPRLKTCPHCGGEL